MTRRQTVIDALNHKNTDTIPYSVDFTMQSDEKMKAYTKDPDYQKHLHMYMHTLQYWGWPTELPDMKEHFKDDFGVIWNRSGADKDIGVPIKKLITDFDHIDYVFPEINEKRIRGDYEELMRTKEDKFTVGAIGFSMFERAWSMAGMPEVLMAMIENPEGLHKFLDMICEYDMKVMDIALEYDLDAFYFGDDWGQQHGMIMGPEYWREFIKPRMKRMYAKAKNKGLFVLQHSCGDIHEIFDDLISIGLDCYQTFQPEIYDIEKIKEKYGRSLSFWGAISTQQLLPKASPEKVRSETARIMKILSGNGGYIASPTHALEFDVPCENISAMLDVFMHQDKYLDR
jgi:uroporphyrinogen decarboxylase